MVNSENSLSINKSVLLQVISIVMLMEMLEATILNTALPQIAKGFSVNPIHLKELLTVYFMALGVFIPVSGWASERFGEKKTLLFAITLFTVSSMACGFAVHPRMLTIFRFVQGIGGAFLMPVGRQIIYRIFDQNERISAMAKINILASMGLILGPLIGGALTTYANWRWIFFINIPIGVMGIVLVVRYLPVFHQLAKLPFDIIGFLLIGIGLGALLFLIDIVIDPTIAIYWKLLLSLISIFSFVIYIPYSQSREHPLIRIDLFRQTDFSFMLIGSFLARLTVTTQPFLVPLLLQAGFGFNAFTAGLLSLPVILATLLSFSIRNFFLRRFDHRRILLFNSFFLLIVFWSYFLQTTALNLPLLVLQQLLIGFLLPFQWAMMNTEIYKNLSEPFGIEGVVVNSINIQVSGSFGIALAALAMIALIGPTDLQHQVPLYAFKAVFIIQGFYLLAALWFFNRVVR